MSNVFRILPTAVMKISLFSILLKKMKKVYRIFSVTQYISDPYFVLFYACEKGKGSPYSIAERRVPELIPVGGSQPVGDVSHKPGGT